LTTETDIMSKSSNPKICNREGGTLCVSMGARSIT